MDKNKKSLLIASLFLTLIPVLFFIWVFLIAGCAFSRCSTFYAAFVNIFPVVVFGLNIIAARNFVLSQQKSGLTVLNILIAISIFLFVGSVFLFVQFFADASNVYYALIDFGYETIVLLLLPILIWHILILVKMRKILNVGFKNTEL